MLPPQEFASRYLTRLRHTTPRRWLGRQEEGTLTDVGLPGEKPWFVTLCQRSASPTVLLGCEPTRIATSRWVKAYASAGQSGRQNKVRLEERPED